MTTPWSLPADLRRHAFAHERSHFPGPVRALDFALNVQAMEQGFNVALAEYEVPLRVIDLHLGGFVYEALVSTDQLVSTDRPAPRLGALRPATSVLDVAVDELPRLWSDEWLPAVQRHLAFWQDFDLAGTTDAELTAHLERTRERCLDMWAVHFRVFLPMLIAIRRFRTLCDEILDGEDVDLLLTGMPSKTTEGDDVLWRLGRELHADSELARALAEGDWPAVRRALGGSSRGRAFLDRLETYLRDYGQRGSDWSIDRPFLIEDPRSILASLRTYAGASGSAREACRAGQEARRAELEAACGRRLAALPHPLARAFQRLQHSARTATWLSEESYHWIEGLGSYSVRRVCLEAGRRLADVGVLATRDDVFHLRPDEIVRALGGTDRRAAARRAAARKADFVRSMSVEPPPTLGASDDASPPSEIGEALDLFFGAPVQTAAGTVQTAAGTADLRGHGASPGVARGVVRVVGSLDEVDTVRAGDVLVAHTTSPGWTPVFRSIAALVTDTGGVLCHAAVVAREYGLPAVVGAGDATRVLRSGQRVEVDGRAGTVRLVDVEDADRSAGVEALHLADPEHLPHSRAALSDLRTPEIAREMRETAEAIAEVDGRPGSTAVFESTVQLAPREQADVERSSAQQVYDAYFRVERTSGNALVALARAARHSVRTLSREMTDANRESTLCVGAALADLLRVLAKEDA